MNPVLKVLLPLAVVLPLGAFVVGSLAASGDEPPPRPTIHLTEAPSATDSQPPSPTPVRPRPGAVDDEPRNSSRGPDLRPPHDGGDDDDDRDDDPEKWDDDHDEDDRDEDEGDDDGDD